MAIYRPSKPPAPIKIEKWIGVNEAVGLTDLKLGEALRQVNFRITQDYKPQKRTGHKTFINYNNTKSVQGLWYGTIGSKEVLISCNDGKVYEYNYATETNSQIGTMTDAKTTIFYFNSLLYFMNGTEYKQYDGTTFQDVVPYVPTIAVATPPAGGGTDYEPINLLTGAKKQEFVADGTATKYVLREKGLDADAVIGWYDGVQKAETTDFTVDRINGEITTLTTLTDKTDVIFQWVKATAGHADLVKKHKYAMTFGPGNDTAVFIWGSPTEKNARRWSGTLKANYFPTTNLTLIGSNQFAITDIKPQYNRQIIFKEDRTHYSYPEYIAETQSYDYPVYDLNEKVGNVAFNQVQIVQNNPVSLKSHSWWLWTSTNVEDERNASPISERLRDSLLAIDLRNAITFDNQKEKEYWCNVGSIVYIWNYGNDTMYTYDNITATVFTERDGTVYYGTTGKIERFEGTNDNGIAIRAQLDTGHYSFNSIHLIKTSDTVYIGLLPDSQTSIKVYFKTNKINEFKALNKVAEYRLLDFNNIDFNNYTFKTNRNPQTFSLRLNSREYTTIQFRFENAELNETCVMLDFLLEAETQGEV